MPQGKRPTNKQCRERTDFAAQLLVDNAGLRPYQLASKFRAKFGGGRRTAARYLTRAREQLAENHGSALRDLASSLPGKFADVLQRARERGDLKVEARVLCSLLQLAGNVQHDESEARSIGIDLVIVESAQGTQGDSNGEGKVKVNGRKASGGA